MDSGTKTENLRLIAEALIFFLSSMTTQAAATGNACTEPKRTETWRLYSECEQKRAAELMSQGSKALTATGQPCFCSLDGTIETKELVRACQDPAGYICQRPQGRTLTSNCQLLISKPKDVVQTPEYQKFLCERDQAWQELFKKYASECPKGNSEEVCQQLTLLSHEKEFNLVERKLLYTSERVARARKNFERVKTKMHERISNSNRIPQEGKKLLLDRISGIELAVSDDLDQLPACAAIESTGLPNTNIYYSSKRVHFCSGAIAMLDRWSDEAMMHTIGHEIGHAVDGCALEESAVDYDDDGKVIASDPEIAMRTYAGIVPCLMGGKGPRGCENSVLHCNSDEGQKRWCQLGHSIKLSEHKMKACLDNLALTPSCSRGVPDETDSSSDLTVYRTRGPARAQIDESISDFLGSEVVGAIIEESGGFSERRKLDILISVATDYIQLHGVCRMKNTSDEHPPGALRVNRVIMSNKRFREAVCGVGSLPPNVDGKRAECGSL